jgi:hypothetical protein
VELKLGHLVVAGSKRSFPGGRSRFGAGTSAFIRSKVRACRYEWSATCDHVAPPTALLLWPDADPREGKRGLTRVVRWWAREVLNLRPLACEASALPLSYAPEVKERLAPRKWATARARVAPPPSPDLAVRTIASARDGASLPPALSAPQQPKKRNPRLGASPRQAGSYATADRSATSPETATLPPCPSSALDVARTDVGEFESRNGTKGGRPGKHVDRQSHAVGITVVDMAVAS